MDRDNKIMEESLNFKKIKKGSILKGEVISSYKDEVVVNINYFCDGIIKRDELLGEDYEKGSSIDVYVVSLDDGFGNIVLSEKKASYINALNKLKFILKSGDKVSVYIKDRVNSGLICEYKGIRGFIPGSRVSTHKVNLNDYIGKNLEVILIELDLNKNRVIFSAKEIEMDREAKERAKFLESLNVGDKFLGRVKSVKDFGAFIDISGVQAFIHKSEVSNKHNFDINSILKVSEKVSVSVLEVDKENNKIYLTMKESNYNPYLEYKNDFIEGNIYDVVVVKILSYGLIVSLNDYLTGFIHVSEISDEHVNLNKLFKIGDSIRAKIICKDDQENKISLSCRDTDECTKNESGYIDENPQNDTLGEVFKDIFLKLR
ncbi:30S ribosomal protein S1 [Candidatus Arthromitus sp. SFB-rat-Yit]|uniref:30S ribosomal protein S1 n=1 Tax=Candidatus Arthromitus sp. SFB-rat-Yit TaxID=1041504 RepID=UPI000227A1DE|nr:S1 RNA-binding domain-containing protein [Candidatus Arthromitus sp. SFB-rat-Yit]BAK80755.1 30S ribosomal protein S1 [Candidatus Arthromitus sp. SFB-rat-Yit]